MIRINKYAVTPPRGPFEIFASIAKNGSTQAGGKTEYFWTTESDHKFGHGDYHTIFYDHKKDSDP